MDTLKSDLKRLAEGILVDKLKSIIEAPTKIPQSDRTSNFDAQLPKSRLDPAYAAHLKKLGDISKGVGQWMVKLTQGAKGSTGWNTAAAAGSKAHTLIYDVGKFFGYSFKPWEAVGMASKLGKVAKFLGPAAAIMQVAGLILEEHLEESQRLKFQKARSGTRALYLGNANSVRVIFAKEFEDFLNDFYGPLMKENDRLMDDLQGTNSRRESEQKLFSAISSETLSLIQDIQAADV